MIYGDGSRWGKIKYTVPRIPTLHTALEYAISQDWVAVNAARGVKVIGSRDEGAKKIVPPSKEALKFLLEAADYDLRLKLIFAASTGVRAGEQWALRWKDIDLVASELKIERRVDVYGEEGPPKSAAGIRTLPISQNLCQLLKAWRLKSNFSKNEDLIFPNAEGKYLSHDNFIKRRFKGLFEKLEKNHAEDPLNKPPAPKPFN